MVEASTPIELRIAISTAPIGMLVVAPMVEPVTALSTGMTDKSVPRGQERTGQEIVAARRGSAYWRSRRRRRRPAPRGSARSARPAGLPRRQTDAATAGCSWWSAGAGRRLAISGSWSLVWSANSALMRTTSNCGAGRETVGDQHVVERLGIAFEHVVEPLVRRQQVQQIAQDRSAARRVGRRSHRRDRCRHVVVGDAWRCPCSTLHRLFATGTR